MSVEYKSILAYGWRVSIEDFVRCTDNEKIAEFEKFFIPADAYYESDYVFGSIVASANEGEMFALNPEALDSYTKEHPFIHVREALKRIGREDLANTPPKFYLICQVY